MTVWLSGLNGTLSVKFSGSDCCVSESICRFSGVANPNLLSVWRNFVEIDRLYPGGGVVAWGVKFDPGFEFSDLENL